MLDMLTSFSHLAVELVLLAAAGEDILAVVGAVLIARL